MVMHSAGSSSQRSFPPAWRESGQYAREVGFWEFPLKRLGDESVTLLEIHGVRLERREVWDFVRREGFSLQDHPTLASRPPSRYHPRRLSTGSHHGLLPHRADDVANGR
jgi:hypothetical protein